MYILSVWVYIIIQAIVLKESLLYLYLWDEMGLWVLRGNHLSTQKCSRMRQN